jgi:hypothetical protein
VTTTLLLAPGDALGLIDAVWASTADPVGMRISASASTMLPTILFMPEPPKMPGYRW